MLSRLPLKTNKIFALRHGQSRANVAGIICSDPSIATTAEFGLSETGRIQAIQAGHAVADVLYNDPEIEGLCIISSDFARAYETAEAVRNVYQTTPHPIEGSNRRDNLPPLYKGQVIVDIRLRERCFGDFDMQSDGNYPFVWDDDAKDSSHTLHQVESVDSVKSRAVAVVNEYDALLQDHMIILVAHGDVLQILQTAFLQMDGRLHRSLEHLETAKLRRMDIST
ncbi:hypothetical protein MPSEU_000666300 [Mayamaea pseudoterrestris]|nr:hypothetical protein MPSEU_000666300 [Mayamaea pseudoterrestris]